MILPVPIDAACQLTAAALLGRNQRVPPSVTLVQIIAAPALKRTGPRARHPHIRIACATCLALSYGLDISNYVVADLIHIQTLVRSSLGPTIR